MRSGRVFHVTEGLDRRGLLLVGLGLLIPTAAGAQAPAPATTGPKKRIAVAKVGATGKMQAAMGGADAGDVLADQLSTIIAQTGQFDVVDRADVTMTLKEQSLTPASATTGAAAAEPSSLLGAQVIVRASITTYDTESGGGLQLGLAGGVLGRNTSKAVVGIDVRLVDTTTGKVIGATHVQVANSQSDFNVSMQNQRGASISKTGYSATPLGKSTASAFQKIADFTVEKLRDVAWTGRVADVTEAGVFLNVGGQNGVMAGDSFIISRVARRIVDPGSGELLGVVETPIGQVKVTDVQDRFCQGQAVGPEAPVRGDIARFLSRAS